MAEYSQGPIAGAPPTQTGYNNVNTPLTSNPNNAFLSTTRPPYPPWLKFFIPLILVFTVGVIAMIGYVVHTLSDGSQSLGFNLFAGVWTLIVGTYLFLAFWAMPQLHYRWIVLILSVLSCIWWLTAFAYLASNTRQVYQAIDLINQYSSYSSSYGFDLSYLGFVKRDMIPVGGVLEKRQSASYYLRLFDSIKKAAAVMAGAAAVGAIVWVLFCIFTGFYAISLFRDSKSASSAVPMAPTAVGQDQKTETYANVQPQPMYPQPVPTEANGFAPARPESTFSATPTYNTVDPRDPRMAPGAEFLTPPPPGAGYVNPQFGGYEVDRNYTVSPLSVSEMPASQPANLVEMPAVPEHRQAP